MSGNLNKVSGDQRLLTGALLADNVDNAATSNAANPPRHDDALTANSKGDGGGGATETTSLLSGSSVGQGNEGPLYNSHVAANGNHQTTNATIAISSNAGIAKGQQRRQQQHQKLSSSPPSFASRVFNMSAYIDLLYTIRYATIALWIAAGGVSGAFFMQFISDCSQEFDAPEGTPAYDATHKMHTYFPSFIDTMDLAIFIESSPSLPSDVRLTDLNQSTTRCVSQFLSYVSDRLGSADPAANPFAGQLESMQSYYMLSSIGVTSLANRLMDSEARRTIAPVRLWGQFASKEGMELGLEAERFISALAERFEADDDSDDDDDDDGNVTTIFTTAITTAITTTTTTEPVTTVEPSTTSATHLPTTSAAPTTPTPPVTTAEGGSSTAATTTAPLRFLSSLSGDHNSNSINTNSTTFSDINNKMIATANAPAAGISGGSSTSKYLSPARHSTHLLPAAGKKRVFKSVEGDCKATVRIVGVPLLINEALEASAADMGKSDGIVLPVALLVMALTVKSLRLMILPMLTVGLSLAVSFAIMCGFTRFMTVSSAAPSLMMSLGICMSIDYCLFLVSRYVQEVRLLRRPEWAAGKKRKKQKEIEKAGAESGVSKNADEKEDALLPADSGAKALEKDDEKVKEDEKRQRLLRLAATKALVGRVVGGAGHTILVSGSTLMLSLIALVFFPINILQSFGWGCSITVLIALVVALTLCPTLLLAFPDFFENGARNLTYPAWVPACIVSRFLNHREEEEDEEEDRGEADTEDADEHAKGKERREDGVAAADSPAAATGDDVATAPTAAGIFAERNSVLITNEGTSTSSPKYSANTYSKRTKTGAGSGSAATTAVSVGGPATSPSSSSSILSPEALAAYSAIVRNTVFRHLRITTVWPFNLLAFAATVAMAGGMGVALLLEFKITDSFALALPRGYAITESYQRLVDVFGFSYMYPYQILFELAPPHSEEEEDSLFAEGWGEEKKRRGAEGWGLANFRERFGGSINSNSGSSWGEEKKRRGAEGWGLANFRERFGGSNSNSGNNDSIDGAQQQQPLGILEPFLFNYSQAAMRFITADATLPGGLSVGDLSGVLAFGDRWIHSAEVMDCLRIFNESSAHPTFMTGSNSNNGTCTMELLTLLAGTVTKDRSALLMMLFINTDPIGNDGDAFYRRLLSLVDNFREWTAEGCVIDPSSPFAVSQTAALEVFEACESDDGEEEDGDDDSNNVTTTASTTSATTTVSSTSAPLFRRSPSLSPSVARKARQASRRIRLYLSGIGPQSMDAVATVYRLFPIVIAVSGAVVLIVVGLSFRSILIPLRCILSIALTEVFVFGWIALVYCLPAGSGIFDWLGVPAVESYHAVPWIDPIVAFSVVLGIALDYDVFLLTRVFELRMMKGADASGSNIKGSSSGADGQQQERGSNTIEDDGVADALISGVEASDAAILSLSQNDQPRVGRNGPLSTHDAIMVGVCDTGPIITAAGVIMSIAFLGMLLSAMPLLNVMGMFLVTAVLFDTFIIRTLLGPSALSLLGEWSWWPRRPPVVPSHF